MPAGSRSDGVVQLRAFTVGDRPAVLRGRDREWARWLGPGDPVPSPTACIEVAGAVVGWIDADETAPWLRPGEANVGYSIFAAHRGHGYAARAVRLLAAELAERGVRDALLVIDSENAASLGVARAAGARLVPGRSVPGLPAALVFAVACERPTTPDAS